MGKNPFYSEVSSAVKGDLNSRVSMYGGDWKSTEDHEFMYRKLPYLIITSADETIEGDNVILSNRGSFPAAAKTFESTYGDWNNDDKTYQINPDSRHLPRPVLTGCTITNQGRYGSTRKATVKFTVFRPYDLKKLTRAFMMPRKKVTIQYGFGNQSLSTRRGIVTGYVYNFNWSLRTEEGGYDCSFDILGPGAFGMGADINSNVTNQGVVMKNDSEGNPINIAVFGARGRLFMDVKNMKEIINPEELEGDNTETENELYTGDGADERISWLMGLDEVGMLAGASYSPPKLVDPGTGEYFKKVDTGGRTFIYAAALVPEGEEDYASEDYKNYSTIKQNRDLREEDPLGAILKNGSYDYYVNIRYIVDVLVNAMILGPGQGASLGSLKASTSTKFYIKCDRHCSLSLLPSDFCTSDPSKVVIPGNMGDYTDGTHNGLTGISFPGHSGLLPSAAQGFSGNYTTIDFSKILINVELLDSIFAKYEKAEYIPVLDFMDSIFEVITIYTGGAIRPTCIIPDEKDAAGNQSNEIQVVDTNFAWPMTGNGQPAGEVTPYTLQSFSKGSIVRDISMDLKLPSKLMTALYVGGGASISATNQRVGRFFGIMGPPAAASTAPVATGALSIRSYDPTQANIRGSREHALKTLKIEPVYAVLTYWTGTSANSSRKYRYKIFKYRSQAASYAQANKTVGNNLGGSANPDESNGGSYSTIYRKIDSGNPDVQSGEVSGGGSRPHPMGAGANGIADEDTLQEQVETTMALESPTTDFKTIKRLINTYGPSTFITNATNQLIKRLCTDGPESNNYPWNQRIMLPLGFKATLDGIEGFRFGNLITSSWLPADYYHPDKTPKIAFMITNVTHNITATEWTTELETQCRINVAKL